MTLAARVSSSGTVAAAEWFAGDDPGAGNGTPMALSGSGPWDLSATIDVGSWADGKYVLHVRAQNADGSWSSLVNTQLVVSPPFPGLYFSTKGNGAVPDVGSPFDNADIYMNDGIAYSRDFDATAMGLPGSANVDGYDRVDADTFYLSFSGSKTPVPGLGMVQDEDVVLYDAGTWSVFFDGTALGLTNWKQDVDAISVIDGQLFFSTTGNTTPPGVGGAADNADIYSWDGGYFSRVWNASAKGVPDSANVDGFVRIDATHFYLSFSGSSTNVSGLGNVQDEDVIYHDAGTWSVFFDGTANGLTGGARDVDAFDVP